MLKHLKLTKNNIELLVSTFLIIVIFVILSVLSYYCFLRLHFSFKFIINSIGYYIKRLFLIDSNIPYNSYNFIIDNLDQGQVTIIPVNADTFLSELKASFFMLFNKTYFLNSISGLTFIFTYLNLIITIILLIISFIVITKQLILLPKNPELVGKTKYLILYENFKANKIDILINELKNYIHVLLSSKIFKSLFIITILLFTNLAAVIIDFIAYLLISLSNILLFPSNIYYFVFSSFTSLYEQLYFIPGFIWLIVIVIVLFRWRINHAKNKIYSLQDLNEDYVINTLGIATLTTGVMGAGKDSFNAAVTLTTQRVFKNQWLEEINNYKAIFKNFDFVSYELYLKEALEKQYFTSSVQIKMMFKKYKDYLAEKDVTKANELLKKYNFPDKFLNYQDNAVFDGREPIDLIDMLSDFGQCYYLYSTTRPNVYSNISMRIPFRIMNEEYFPIFDFDIFNDKDVENYQLSTHRCRIWNFDWWRLGNRFFANSGVSDCGIYNLSEGGKERGNMFTNSGKDKLDYEPNQKNDEFNKFVKLIRHLYTIDNTPYVKLLVNDQRIGSINADLSELFETTVSLKKEKKIKNALLLYNLVDKTIIDSFLNPINKLLQEYRITRNYDSLLSHFLYFIANKLTMHKLHCESYFNYKVLKTKVSQIGGVDEESKATKFYLIYKEVYSGIYATDCYFGLFEPLIEKKENKIVDCGDYLTKYASLDEFKKQNSLLINDIEDCKAFNPELTDSEFEAKYKLVIQEALKSYPDVKLRDIFKKLKIQYGKEIGSYSDFLKFSKKHKLYDEKARKKSK